MEIKFLFYEDCPSHEDALERLRALIEREGVDASITVMEVKTEEQAKELKFIGSPTIRIEGRDIDPPPADAHYGLTCRAYTLSDGRISPLPSEDMIRNALITVQKERHKP